jgi:HlyD family secretion protein
MARLPRLLQGSLVASLLTGRVGLWALARRDDRAGGLQVAGTIEATQVEVGPKTTARIVEVRVEEGSRIRRGDLLVVLDSAELAAEVTRLEAAVRVAQAQLRDLRAGARLEELAEARAMLARAEAQLADLLAGARREEIQAVRQVVAQAEARLRDLEAPGSGGGARAPGLAEATRKTLSRSSSGSSALRLGLVSA